MNYFPIFVLFLIGTAQIDCTGIDCSTVTAKGNCQGESTETGKVCLWISSQCQAVYDSCSSKTSGDCTSAALVEINDIALDSSEFCKLDSSTCKDNSDLYPDCTDNCVSITNNGAMAFGTIGKCIYSGGCKLKLFTCANATAEQCAKTDTSEFGIYREGEILAPSKVCVVSSETCVDNKCYGYEEEECKQLGCTYADGLCSGATPNTCESIPATTDLSTEATKKKVMYNSVSVSSKDVCIKEDGETNYVANECASEDYSNGCKSKVASTGYYCQWDDTLSILFQERSKSRLL